MVYCSIRQLQVGGIQSTEFRMLECPKFHISPSSFLLDFILLSWLHLPASSQNPQCPEAQRILEWRGGDWLLKCKPQLPSSTPKTGGERLFQNANNVFYMFDAIRTGLNRNIKNKKENNWQVEKCWTLYKGKTLMEKLYKRLLTLTQMKVKLCVKFVIQKSLHPLLTITHSASQSVFLCDNIFKPS